MLPGVQKVWVNEPSHSQVNSNVGSWTPKWSPKSSEAQFQGSKLIVSKSSLYHWKTIKAQMSEMGSNCSFGHLKHKLWSKERSGVKLAVWLSMTHSQLLAGLKCESKWKTAEERGVGMRSLAHNTLRGRGACWSSGMGLGRIDKLIHSHGPAHNPHKIVNA
jgi:hypothetical protein